MKFVSFLYFALSTPDFLIQEDMLSDAPWRREVVRTSLVTENGDWLPTAAPELGIEATKPPPPALPLRRRLSTHSRFAPTTGRSSIGRRR